MKAPKNRKVFVVGYGAATPLGSTFEKPGRGRSRARPVSVR